MKRKYAIDKQRSSRRERPADRPGISPNNKTYKLKLYNEAKRVSLIRDESSTSDSVIAVTTNNNSW